MRPLPFTPQLPRLTERLRLRWLEPGDLEAIVAYRGRDDVARYVPFDPMTPERVRERLRGQWSRRALDGDGQVLFLGIERREVPGILGDVMLALRSVTHQSAEIGWVLHPDHGGAGYATEAARAILTIAFGELGVHRVVARVDARNDASRALAARLGMRQEAHLVENEWFKGAWSDEVDFAILAHEFSG